jgi:sensor histidine kinase YesM
MALQPLVENALRHGIARTSAAGTIQIKLRAGDSVVIQVKDDGPGFTGAERPEGWGIGLANTRARLAQLYGDRASLTIDDGAPGAVVTLVLPYHSAPDTPARDMVHAAHFANR